MYMAVEKAGSGTGAGATALDLASSVLPSTRTSLWKGPGISHVSTTPYGHHASSARMLAGCIARGRDHYVDELSNHATVRPRLEQQGLELRVQRRQRDRGALRVVDRSVSGLLAMPALERVTSAQLRVDIPFELHQQDPSFTRTCRDRPKNGVRAVGNPGFHGSANDLGHEHALSRVE